jgi:hypothetical protein
LSRCNTSDAAIYTAAIIIDLRGDELEMNL